MKGEKVVEQVEESVHWTAHIIDYLWDYFTANIMDFIGAFLIILIGIWAARLSKQVSERLMKRSHIDVSVMGFVSQIVYFTILAIVAIAALSKLGVPTSSFVAALGGIGIGIGLALKDNVGNLAAGILILIFKPFRVGDYVIVDTAGGTVTSITLMNTHLQTLSNEDFIVPNNMMTSSIVRNYSVYPTRYMEMYISVDYNSDLELVLKLLRGFFEEDPGVLNGLTMPLGVREFADNSIRIYARPEVESDKYWASYYRVMIGIKKLFDENGINIPYPQRVLHIINSLDEEPPRTLAEEAGIAADGTIQPDPRRKK